MAIAVDGGGNLYIADFTNARVLKETPSASGYTESVAADNNSSPYPLSGPLDVAVDGNGNVYILDSTNHSVIRETPSGGAYVQSFVVQSGAIYGFGQLMGIAVDPFGNVYIADNTFAKVVVEDIFDPPRIYFETVTDGSTSQPQSVQVINNGNQTLTAVDPGLVVAGTTKAGDFIQVPGSGTLTDCAADFSIDPGLACNLSLEFAPSSVESGTITGAATLTDNSLDGTTSPQTIVLTGTAQVASQAPAITSADSTTFTVGTAGTFKVTASGSPTLTFSESGTLPSGVTFDPSTGILSGTPGSTTGGTYSITFGATNGVAPDATQNFTLTVDEALTITSADSTTFTVGTASTFTVTATGYPSPKLSESGMLPKGVTFNASTGALSGTPLASYGGTYTITFTAKNDLSYATQSFTLTVDEAPVISSANNATFTVGASGSFPVTATGYPAPTFSETGTLPTGVTLDSTTGALAGKPAAGAGGTYPITLKATNGIGTDATQNFTLTVNEAPGISSANNTTFAAGAVGNFTVTTTGYPAPSLTETGALPSGVTFTDNGNGTARLVGTPAAGTSGSYPITITASNGVGTNATQTFTLTVNTAPAITSANKATCTTGAWWSFTVTATGTPTPALSESGALPGGMTFNPSTGVLAGTPAAGSGDTYNITLTASNGVLPNSTQNFTLTVDQAPAITSANSTTFKVGALGSFTVTANGYPASLSLGESGALPGRVTFNAATGVLSGTPASGTGGTYNIMFTASNGVAPNATQNFTLNVSSSVLRTITVAPANASVPAGLTQQFSATAHYSDGSTQDVTSGVTWTSSATFVARITSGGLATGVAQGRTTITAAQGSIRGSTTLTVIAPLLQSIDARPSNASIFTGQSQEYVALGHFSNGSAQNISDTVRWSSSNVSVATISPGGSARGVGVGTITITATRGGVSGTASLTVNPVLVSITVTPANPSIKVGIKTQFTATGTYSDRSKQDLTASARWTSSSTGVATINAAGLATGASAGRTTIRATVGQTSGTTQLTVTR